MTKARTLIRWRRLTRQRRRSNTWKRQPRRGVFFDRIYGSAGNTS
ncbi:hypothetical protein ACP70R_008684 [Stipagrostis hirtigluma subsp. patula]